MFFNTFKSALDPDQGPKSPSVMISFLKFRFKLVFELKLIFIMFSLSFLSLIFA